jgi:hypothetical protein
LYELEFLNCCVAWRFSGIQAHYQRCVLVAFFRGASNGVFSCIYIGWDGTIVFYYIRRPRGLALISVLMDTVLFGIVITVVGLHIPERESFYTYFGGCRYMTCNRNKKKIIREEKVVPSSKQM